MSVSAEEFRQALRSFASGVTVITAMGADNRPAGVTVSAFSSVSLAPPLVLFCMDKSTASLATFANGKYFAVNILASDQRDLSNVFASGVENRFAGVEIAETGAGCPVLVGVLSVLECQREAVHDGGDHLIIVGRVTAAQTDTSKRPLIYALGQYAQLD